MRSADAVRRLRVAWYRRQWTCKQVSGTPLLLAPALLAGAGSIRFEADVTLGWPHGPGFFSDYTYIEARHSEASVSFGERTHLNNGVTIVSEGPGITVGRSCLIGPGVHVYDSDFHALDALDRETSQPRRAAVDISDDVFIGTNAIILKGVQIGAGSVVGAGAVVSSSVPAGARVAGNPARPVNR